MWKSKLISKDKKIRKSNTSFVRKVKYNILYSLTTFISHTPYFCNSIFLNYSNDSKKIQKFVMQYL